MSYEHYSSEKLEAAKAYYQELFNDLKRVPYLEELALQVDCDTDTVTNWAAAHAEFRSVIKKIKELQRLRLQQKGMDGKIKATMPIFLLKANHGFKETSVQEHHHSFENLGDDELDKLIDQKSRQTGIASVAGGEAAQNQG